MEDRASLPEDMLIEILISLPIKSLMRFKCISKYWCTLIKSSTFINWHLKLECKKILLVKRYLPPQNSWNDLYKGGGDDILSYHDPDFPELVASPSLTVPFLNEVYVRSAVNLMGPCIGLICFMYNEVVVLCNPALREFKLLEPSPFARPDNYTASHSGSGFGFDANSNSYKIIQIWRLYESDANYYNEDEYIRVDLYNSSTNSWKIIDVEVPDIVYNREFDLLFNGAWHWQANEFILEPLVMGFVLSFDFSNEVVKLFEFPDWFDDEKRPGLMALNECLALVRYSKDIQDPYLVDIGMMKENGVKESWTKVLVIGPYLVECPLLCWKNKWVIVESSNGHLACCALHANEIKTFQTEGLKGSLKALILTESIIRLDQVVKFGYKQG